ncbi:hypothetical protein AB0F07_07580 [Streptomyces fructofermentans]|uniref:hypothetical protein n=1 Tax=Streptomyces fructofermentans TaxID=152141 RepID=UPI00340C4960
MHTYDSPRRLPYTSPVPARLPQALQSGRTGRASEPQDTACGPSATPIYDALYAEYRRSFRTLPGDRSGEEGAGFTAFGSGPHGSGAHGVGSHGSGPHGTGLHGTGLLSTSTYNPGAYTPGSYGARHGGGQHQTGHVAPHQSPTITAVWQPSARQHSTVPAPPALPPGPRREH